MDRIRPAPDDPGAQPAVLGCSKTASQPLSQIQWPGHRSRHRLIGVRGQRGCDLGEPEPFPPPRARVQAVAMQWLEHPLSLRPRRHDADRLNDRVVDNGAGVDEVPRRHRQARRAAARPDQKNPVNADGLGSSRSSGHPTERCRQIIHQIQKLLKAYKFHRLSDSGVAHNCK